MGLVASDEDGEETGFLRINRNGSVYKAFCSSCKSCRILLILSESLFREPWLIPAKFELPRLVVYLASFRF